MGTSLVLTDVSAKDKVGEGCKTSGLEDDERGTAVVGTPGGGKC